jgi:hypothetical protein
MKLKHSMLISIFLLITAQLSAADRPPAYSEQAVNIQPQAVTAQPAPQIITIERTVTVCPQCNCTTNGVIRVCTCLASPVILPIAFLAGAIHGCACGGLETCAEISKKSNDEEDVALGCCACCCWPCICIAGTVAGIGGTAVLYVKNVVNFIKNGSE